MANAWKAAAKHWKRRIRQVASVYQSQIAQLLGQIANMRQPIIVRAAEDCEEDSAMAIGSMILSQVASAVTQSILLPATRELGYHTNYVVPNVVPDFAQILSAYYTDGITRADALTLMRYNGIRPTPQLAGDPENTATMRCWRAVMDNGRPTLDIGTAKGLYDRQYISAANLRSTLARHGITGDWEVEQYTQRRNLPSLSVYTDAYLQGRIELYQYADAIVRTEGIEDSEAYSILTGQRTPLDPDQVRARYYVGTLPYEDARAELGRSGYGLPGDWERFTHDVAGYPLITAFQIYWRGRMDDTELGNWLEFNGYRTAQQVEQIRAIMRPLPSASDLTLFSVREVWDQAVVDRWGYDEEFPEPYRYWLAQQGLDWTEDVTAPDGTVTPGVPWPKAYWRAHWQTMAPHQAYVAYHMLRPERLDRYLGQIPELEPFEFEDLQTVLKVADYPGPIRNWLAASAFAPLGMREVRQAYIRGAKDRAWAIANLRDHGYLEESANDLVDLWDAELEYRDGAPIRAVSAAADKAVVGKIVEGYAVGWLSRAEATARLNAHALPTATIDNLLDVADQEQYVAYLAEYVKAVKREFLDGSLSLAEAGLRLQGAQITSERVALTLQRWGQLMTTRRKALTSAQIIALAKQGILTPAAASVRLTNLGWVQGDIALQLLSVQRSLSLAQQRAANADNSKRIAARKALAQAAKQAAGLRKQAIAQLRSMYPKAEMKRWLKEGIVNVNYVIERLREQQRSPDYIAAFIADSEYVKPPKPKAAKGAPAQAPVAPGTPPTGPVG